MSTAIKHPAEVSKDVIEINSTEDVATESDGCFDSDDEGLFDDEDYRRSESPMHLAGR